MSAPSNPPPAAPAPAGGAPPDPQPGPTLYRVGTLTYTKAGLFILFSWLLWGDFCFTLFENVGGPGILTLYLQDNFRVSNWLVTLLFTTVPMLIGVIVGPILSFKSDRHRGPRGRRIPFILWTTPFLCFFAAAIGFADDLMTVLKTALPPDHAVLNPFNVAMAIIAILVVGFSFFNEFVNTVFWYLFSDVVPKELIGRFLGLFRLVGAGAGFLLNYFLGEYMMSHMSAIHVGVAVLYFVGFTAMCLKVKEGEYPPPADVTEKTSFREKVGIYFRQCFTHRIFLLVYASSFVFVLARTASLSPLFPLHMGKHTAMVEAAHAGPVTALAATPDARRLVTVGADGAVRLWDGERQALPSAPLDAVRRGTLHEVRQLAPPGGPELLAAAMARDASRVVVGGTDGIIRVWSVADGAQQELKGHEGAVRALVLSPDGTRLASGGGDGSVRLWAMPSGEPLDSFAGTKAIRSLAFSRSGDRLASGAEGGEVRIRRLDAPVEDVSFTAPGPVYALSFLPSLKQVEAPARTGPIGIAILDWPILYLRDVFTNESLYDRPGDQRSAIQAEDGWLATGGQEGGRDDLNARVWIWSTAEGAKVSETGLKGHKGAITGLAYQPELHLLVSGSADKSLRLWDPTRADPHANDMSVKNMSGYTEGITAVAVQERGLQVVSSSTVGGLHLWNSDAGISLKKAALMASFFGIISLILAYPMGALIDRFHAVRIAVWVSLALVPIPFLTYFLVVDYETSVRLEMFKVPLFAIISAAGMPLLISVFPKESFGQMCSANGLVKQGSMMVLAIVGAWFMDLVTRSTLLVENFRYAFLWVGAGFVLQFIIYVLLYREWKKLGGINYRAPGSTGDDQPAQRS